MIRHIWSVFCSRTSIDQTTNNISLFEVLESVQLILAAPLDLPAAIPFDGTLVTLWGRADVKQGSNGEGRLRLLAPNGDELASNTYVIDLTAAPRTRQRAVFNGLRIAGNGLHEFEVSWRLNNAEPWQAVAMVPFDITLQVEPDAATRPRGQ